MASATADACLAALDVRGGAPTQAVAARHGAGFLSLVSAALPELRSQGAIEPGDRVVVFDTGAGFKSTLP
jgi:hypothetical protein